jgi:DTW domain-containing protein YfiP
MSIGIFQFPSYEMESKLILRIYTTYCRENLIFAFFDPTWDEAKNIFLFNCQINNMET